MMQPSSRVEQPVPQSLAYSVPAAYADQLVQLVRRWDVSAEEMLSAVGLSESEVQEPHGRLPIETFAALIERARTLTGEPGLGFYLGLQKRISMYGYLGFAAMSAGSLREALEMFVRFTPTLTTSISLRLHVEGRLASLIIEEHFDLGSARDVALINLVVGMRGIGRALTGRHLEGDHADIAIAEPPYLHRFKHLVPHTRWGQPVTRVVFDAAYLELPLAQGDRVAVKLAREQCERALDALGYDGDFVERVRRAIANGENAPGFRSLEGVAASLAVSPCTLKRRLAAEGISFSSLLDRERREKALLLLESPRLSLDQVAQRLGYSTVPNFVRAFHRWTGGTPAAYRRGRRASPPSARAIRLATGSFG
jgi:AraC-like DNA-binding protein